MSRIVLYTTQNCPFCQQAEHLLSRRNAGPITKIQVDQIPGQMQKMIRLTGRRTVPQIYIGDRHIGGYSDLAELDRTGELKNLLNTG